MLPVFIRSIFQRFTSLVEALNFLRYEVRSCFRIHFVISIFAEEMNEIFDWLKSVLLKKRRDDRPLVNMFLSLRCLPLHLFWIIHNFMSESLSTALIKTLTLSKESQRS